MANHVSNGPCSNCGSRDNRAKYDDGSEWCWSCGHTPGGYTPPTLAGRVKARVTSAVESDKVICLPNDFEPGYVPFAALMWIQQYELTKADMIALRAGWSDYWQRLIFPVIVEGKFYGWTGRYFGNEEHKELNEWNGTKKWWIQGKIKDTLQVLPGTNHTELLMVEDLISATKLQKATKLSSCPLFGSSLTGPQKRFILKSKFKSLIFWLDRDKLKESYRMAGEMQRLGFETRVICTDVDPKEVPIEEIKEIVNGKNSGN